MCASMCMCMCMCGVWASGMGVLHGGIGCVCVEYYLVDFFVALLVCMFVCMGSPCLYVLCACACSCVCACIRTATLFTLP